MATPKINVKYVSYHSSGLHRAEVAYAVDFNGGTLVGEYVEGAKKWPRLVDALEKCRQEGATLIIAKLGRLVRNPHFLANLGEAGVDFVCLDNPMCNHETVHILRATAETVSEQIIERTRRTTAEAVARKGIKLGSARPGHWTGRKRRRGTRQAIAKSVEMRRARAQQTYQYILPKLKEMRLAGKMMREIADWLNDHGHLTTAGLPFTDVAVHRVIKRYLGDDFLGKVRDRGGNPRTIRAMETIQ
jgi:DNA invertase Pin-like site-specific DNA recombinase